MYTGRVIGNSNRNTYRNSIIHIEILNIALYPSVLAIKKYSSILAPTYILNSYEHSIVCIIKLHVSLKQLYAPVSNFQLLFLFDIFTLFRDNIRKYINCIYVK